MSVSEAASVENPVVHHFEMGWAGWGGRLPSVCSHVFFKYPRFFFFFCKIKLSRCEKRGNPLFLHQCYCMNFKIILIVSNTKSHEHRCCIAACWDSYTCRSYLELPSGLYWVLVPETDRKNACFPFSLAGPGVAGYLTAGTSSSAMSNLPPPVDHEAGDLGYQTWSTQTVNAGRPVLRPHSSNQHVETDSAAFLLVSWQCYSFFYK